MSHTATPWSATPSQTGEDIWIGNDVENAACVHGYNDHPHNIANAASIVKAVNAHDELVAALQEIADRHIPDQPAAYGGDELEWAQRQHSALRAIARAALAKAEATSIGDASLLERTP